MQKSTALEALGREATLGDYVRVEQTVEVAVGELRRNARRRGVRGLLVLGTALSTPPSRAVTPHLRESLCITARWAQLPLRLDEDGA